ncbi:CDP-glycerol glycerophosphotransferase family protein [Mycoplasma sp. P36-A1]|uniref:CDP-glycerol glycerophosphotransferase family protein n=1 Tax=Mycoplasma sp. P36-A1 TaxID=3252900 RepID=UPI003C2E77B3
MKRIKNKVKRVLKETIIYKKHGAYIRSKRREKRIQWMNKYKNEIHFDNKTVLFISYLGKYYSDSPRAIYEEMMKNPKFDDYTFVWVFKNTEKAKKIKQLALRTKIIEYMSEDYFKALYQAKYWITNNRMTEYVEKNEGQVYVQTWHGTPFKRIGFDIEVEGENASHKKNELLKLYEEDAENYDFMPSPSKYYTDKITSAFNLKALDKEKVVHETGYPRNDFLYNYTNDDVKKVKDILEIPEDKKVILYAPTWRDNQYKEGVGYTFDVNIDFDLLKEQLKDEYVIIFRPHYFIASKFKFSEYKGFVYNGTLINDINYLYVISDILITDYSSVFFDYSNLRRKILFYMYDYEYYKNTLRGFYFDASKLPGPISENEQQLIKDIKSDLDANKIEEFAQEFNTFDDGKAASRVVEQVFK